jgi:hypothetical protein
MMGLLPDTIKQVSGLQQVDDLDVFFKIFIIVEQIVLVDQQLGIWTVLPRLFIRPNHPVPSCGSSSSNRIDVIGSLMKWLVDHVNQLEIWVPLAVKSHPLFDLVSLIGWRKCTNPGRNLLALDESVALEQVPFDFVVIPGEV